MKEGWKVKKLGEVCKIIMGQSPSSESYNNTGKGVPFFQGCSDFGNLNPCVTTYCSTPKKMADINDVLISVRAPIGTLNISNVLCCIGRGLASIREIESISKYKYVYYFLLKSKSLLQEQGTGATFKAIGKDTLVNFLIPIPPLEEQSQIVEELDQLNNIIEKQRQQLSELDNLTQSIFYDMFGDPVTNEKGWDVENLKSLTSKIGSGSTPKGGNESYKDEGISLIRSLNVYNNYFKYKCLAHIDNEQATSLNNVTIEKGDVLLNITGASVARCCIVPVDVLPARVNQHVSIIRGKDIINNLFLNYLLTSSAYQSLLIMLSKSNGTTREALTKSQLEALKIILPPLSLQQLFAQKIEAIEQEKEFIKQSIAETEELFNSRMDYYFNS